MKQKLINDVVQGMLPFLNNAQAERLQDVLQHALWRYEVCETKNPNRSRIWLPCSCPQRGLKGVRKNL